ncbi:hypothetical protein ADL27_34730, partial [Streptomyces sp. NRRL F-6602]
MGQQSAYQQFDEAGSFGSPGGQQVGRGFQGLGQAPELGPGVGDLVDVLREHFERKVGLSGDEGFEDHGPRVREEPRGIAAG